VPHSRSVSVARSVEAVDDAGGGRRGARASSSAELLAFVARTWGIDTEEATDLGGSVNLNLRLDVRGESYVARVYRPNVSAERLDVLQAARDRLRAGGVPCVEILPTRSGQRSSTHRGRLVEVERFVAATERMDTIDRIERGLPMLARCHALLADVAFSEAATPAFANHVSAQEARTATAAGTRRIRSWSPTASELAVADDADRLASTLAELEAPSPTEPQLVHGDFWDDNVRFCGDDVALVADLDFAGVRPRIDDLALSLYFTSVDLEDLVDDPKLLRRLVDAYDAGADRPLSELERLQLPAAMARQPLWSIGVWVALLDDVAAARAHLRASAREIRWGLRAADAVVRLQAALLSPDARK